MINYIVFTIILMILIFVFVIAIKAMYRGIKAKQNLNRDFQNNKNRRNNNEKKYIPNFLVEKNHEVTDFNQMFKGLKLISDYLDKSILKPNNIPHPKSRIEFLNSIKE